MEKAPSKPQTGSILSKTTESLGDDINVSDDILSAAHNEPKKNKDPLFKTIFEKVLLDNIKRVVPSAQIDNCKDNINMKNGKANWTKTHFIFGIDCSGSMNGDRWESVMIGYKLFLEKVKTMRNIVVSTFTFDDNPNPFSEESEVQNASVF